MNGNACKASITSILMDGNVPKASFLSIPMEGNESKGIFEAIAAAGLSAKAHSGCAALTSGRTHNRPRNKFGATGAGAGP